jgi:hypothetical protein
MQFQRNQIGTEDHDKEDEDPIETQAHQAQTREYPVKQVERRTDEMDPLRKLGGKMIVQAKKDLIDMLYKDKTPDPDPKQYIFGSGIEKACEWAGVSVRRVRRSMRQIIQDAEGPLVDRKFAAAKEVEAAEDEWITTHEAVDRFAPESHETVARWCNEGQVNALKAREDGFGTFHWMIRVDDTLFDKLNWYRSRYGS